jgi:hypothetical protein
MSAAINQKARVRNFADLRDGAVMLPEITSPLKGTQSNDWMITHDRWSPLHFISEEVLRIGDCLVFASDRFTVGIQLPELISITSVGLDSPDPRVTSPNTASTAPRRLCLWGRLEADGDLPPNTTTHTAAQLGRLSVPSKSKTHFVTKADDQFALLLEFHYQPHKGPTLQSFALPRNHWSTTLKFRVVLLEAQDNWGSAVTTLYYFSIHNETHLS